MSKKIIPQRSIVPGMLSGIDYSELIKRDSKNVSETMKVSEGKKPKTKTYSINNRNVRNKM